MAAVKPEYARRRDGTELVRTRPGRLLVSQELAGQAKMSRSRGWPRMACGRQSTARVDVGVNIQPQSFAIPQRAGESPDPRLGIVKRRSWIEEIARDMCREVYEATNAQPDAWCDIDDEVSIRVLVAYAAVRRWLVVDWSKDRVRLTDEGRQEVRKTLS
jgi:hypothetical protein